MHSIVWLASLLCVLGLSRADDGFPMMEFKPVSELPADIPTCRQDDLNINECIKSAFQTMMHRMKDGVKELNIPPIDPLVIDKTTFDYDSGVVQGRITLKDIHAYGLSDAIVENADFDLKDGHVRMEVISKLPQMLFEGFYKANIKFNDIKMTPKGFFNVSLSNLVLTGRAEGDLYERDGHHYLRLSKFEAIPDVGDMRIYASGLFPDENLNTVILDFINQYWRPIFKAMLPETRRTFEPILVKGTNDFFAALPFDFLITKN